MGGFVPTRGFTAKPPDALGLKLKPSGSQVLATGYQLLIFLDNSTFFDKKYFFALIFMKLKTKYVSEHSKEIFFAQYIFFQNFNETKIP